MKKIYLATALAAVAALSSCTKDNSLVITDETATDPVIQSFTATVEDSKATVDGVSVKWTNLDTLSLFDGETTSKGVKFSNNLTAASATADFTGTGAAQTSGFYYAACPASCVSSWNKDGDNCLRYTIPTIQYAVVNNFSENAHPMVAKTDGTSLSFTHLCGYIKITFGASSPKDIVQVDIAEGAGSMTCGSFIYDYMSETPTIKYSSAGNKAVILKNEDGSALATGTYYIAVRPRTWAGITVSFTNSAGKTATASTSESVDLSAGHVQSLGEVKGLTFATAPEVGSVYYESSVAKGIVVSITAASNYYTIMSLDRDSLAWGDRKDALVIADKVNGPANTATLATEGGSSLATKYPAANFCISKGDDWYFPSRDEVTAAFTACGLNNTTNLASLNTTLQSVGGTPIYKTQLWSSLTASSTDTNGDIKAYYVYVSSKNAITSGGAVKSGIRLVRCFKRISY